MIVEIHGNENTVFLLTIPGPSVSSTLEILRFIERKCFFA